MGQWQFHTPDGVADLLPDECEAKRTLEQRLRQLFRQRGYQEIETPGIEFYDVYAAGSGFVPQEGLFKFFDQQGRILCLRYDGTVPAARLAATLYRDVEPPLRFSYIGSMYRYHEYGGGRQREFSQAGVELMGSRTPESDAEVIATAIAAALACGIEDLQVSIGQVEFFRGLLAEWQITGEDAALLPRLIDSKEMVALEELSDRLALPESARDVLLKMASSYGTYDLLDDLARLVTNPAACAALDNLRAVLRILEDYDYLKYVSIDLGMLQSLNYYTGIIFKGFTYGLGFPLFSGGRYDRLVEAFGRELSATGFSIGVSLALTALRRRDKAPAKPEDPLLLGYAPNRRAEAFTLAGRLRAAGQRVICDCQNQGPAALLAGYPSGPVAYLDEKGRLIQLREVRSCKC
ncbi:MAG: ATP phosphoribosyltransferase regulatory subunit [Clostridiaceae bacterium]|nr:ATP phosphoribosyltransferase regulatory subunit [Clostridiaceae bacterium]